MLEIIVRFFRDDLIGFNYFIYAMVIIFFIFAIIGYMVTQSYSSSN